MSARVCRGQLRDRAAHHQHGLHLWTLHLRGHPAGEQRGSAAVPGWCAAHPVHQQVRPAHKATAERLFVSDLTHSKQMCLLFSLQGTLDLNSILEKAESHLYNYCKRCTWDYMSGQCSADESRGEDFLYLLRGLLVLKWHPGLLCSCKSPRWIPLCKADIFYCSFYSRGKQFGV